MGDTTALDQARAAGFESQQCSEDLSAELAEVPLMAHRDDVVVFDFIHPAGLEDLDALICRIDAWTSHCAAAVLIDGGARQSLRHRFPDMDVLKLDLLIAPYAGEAKSEIASCRELVGPAYFPLPSNYAGLRRRTVTTSANRVLVTCGGADPFSVTPRILDSLESIEQVLRIRVIQGPMFGEDLKHWIRDHAKQTRHAIEVDVDPPDLVAQMLWCDLAIATSGLTKYELAATGTPSLLMAIDAAHEEADEPFLKEGTARSLGVIGRVSSDEIAATAIKLLASRSERQLMAERGQKLVDGRGLERILQDLLVYARN